MSDKARLEDVIRVTKSVEWIMGHRLPFHDGACWNPHGHDYTMELTMSGNPVSQSGDAGDGMVIDFSTIKKILNLMIVDVLDHGFLLSKDDEIMMMFFKENPNFKHTIMDSTPTAENIAIWCFHQIFPKLADASNITIENIRIYESAGSWADYSPES